MNIYKSIALLILLLLLLFSTAMVYQIESKKRVLNEDLVELSLVKYGIFNVDIWKASLTTIVSERINDFDFEDMDEAKIRIRISEFLTLTVDELEESFYKQNKGSIGGFLKGGVASITDVFGVMKEDIPLLTESIVSFFKDDDNKEMIKNYIIIKLNEYSDATFSEIDYTIYDIILERHGQITKAAAIDAVATKIEILNEQQRPYTFLIFMVITLLAAFTIFSKNLNKNEFLILSLSCAVLLTIGVLLPMINIDARISKMDFHLMGESISFTDQILYFKSKSILEVVQVMILNSKMEVVAVGILILLFSVVFPLSKLISSVLFIYSEKLRNNAIVKFLIFKTAKWTMADVMVVAIFMAYIGFSGIISEQLKDLETIVTQVDMLTTNGSSLQIGFFLFTAFAFLSLLVSHKLQYSYGKKIEGTA
ncbi:MAG: paraquat-inducible protein A [Balneolaceae bacterium]